MASENSTQKAWAVSLYQYQAARDATPPGIFLDCSPSQYAGMSKRGQRAYMARQEAARDKAAQAFQNWKTDILAAFCSGVITQETPGLHPEAVEIITLHLRDQERQRQEEFEAGMIEWNHWPVIEVGNQVWDVLYRQYVTITKVNKKTVRVEGERTARPYRVHIGHRLTRMSHSDLTAHTVQLFKRHQEVEALKRYPPRRLTYLMPILRPTYNQGTEDWQPLARFDGEFAACNLLRILGMFDHKFERAPSGRGEHYYRRTQH